MNLRNQRIKKMTDVEPKFKAPQEHGGSRGGGAVRHKGIECPYCGCSHLYNADGKPWDITNTVPQSGFIMRKRICRNCGKQITTRERIVN